MRSYGKLDIFKIGIFGIFFKIGIFYKILCMYFKGSIYVV